MPKPEDLKKAFKGDEEALRKVDTLNDPLLATPGASQVLLIGMQIDSDAGDSDDWTRLAGTQFRLVARSTRDEGGKAKPPIYHYPVGYILAVSTADGEVPKWKFTAAPMGKGVAQVGKLLATWKRNELPVIYWVYQLGQDEKPDYVVFRQVSIKEVPRCKPEMPALPKPVGGVAPKPGATPVKPPSAPAKAPEKTPAKAPAKAPAKK